MSTVALETDIDDNCFVFISLAHDAIVSRSQASSFDGFKHFVPVFLCKSYIVDDAVTASVMHICSFHFLSSFSLCLFGNVLVCVCV